MKTPDFTTSFTVAATPRHVFNAIKNVRGWWSGNIEGDTDRQGAEFEYHYQDVHRARMRITEWVADRRIVWHVVDNYFKFTKDKTEWTGTDVIFDISPSGDETKMTFTHRGLVPDYECFQICHDAWTYYIQESLRELIMTGAGKPTPRDTGNGGAHPETPGGDRVHAGLKCICHRLLIQAPAEKVYEALTTQKGLAGWWTPDTKAEPRQGTIARFAFGPDYFKEMEILELRPYSHVRWLCLKAHEEWIGTVLTFELEPHARGTVLNFRHDGWKQYTPEFSACSFAWALFFRSLRFLCETGKGFPYPDFER